MNANVSTARLDALILNFLVAIEDDLAIESDEPRDTFWSIETIAQALRDSYHVRT